MQRTISAIPTPLVIIFWGAVGAVAGFAVVYVFFTLIRPSQPWSEYPSPSLGARKILAFVFGGPFTDHAQSVYVAGTDGLIYECSRETNSCFDTTTAIPQEKESCVSELPMPRPPAQPVDQVVYHRCAPDAVMQISFAILPDGKIWYWYDFSDGTKWFAQLVVGCAISLLGAVAASSAAALVSWQNRRLTRA